MKKSKIKIAIACTLAVIALFAAKLWADVVTTGVTFTDGIKGPGTTPAGMVMTFAGSTCPTGWFEADGSTRVKVDYPDLFAAIGTSWDLGHDMQNGVAYTQPGSGTFRLPDLRGAFVRGVGTPSGGTATALADFNGQGTKANGLSSHHTHGNITSGSVPNKDFGTGNVTSSTDTHTHAFWGGANASTTITGINGGSDFGNWSSGWIDNTAAPGTHGTLSIQGDTHSHTIAYSNFDHTHAGVTTNIPQISSTLSSTDIETMPMNIGLTYCIKY